MGLSNFPGAASPQGLGAVFDSSRLTSFFKPARSVDSPVHCATSVGIAFNKRCAEAKRRDDVADCFGLLNKFKSFFFCPTSDSTHSANPVNPVTVSDGIGSRFRFAMRRQAQIPCIAFYS